MGPRQKSIKYLGPAVLVPFEHDISMEKYLFPKHIEDIFKVKFVKEIYQILLKRELVRHGFTEKGDILESGEIIVDLKKKKVRRKGKDIVIKMNEGFLCGQTMTDLFEHTQVEDETGKKLAEDILEAGIAIEKENFVKLYRYLKVQQ